jgi:hypothetical protein
MVETAMADAELLKLNQLIKSLDDAIDKHVRELAKLAEHNGYSDQAEELHHLIEKRNHRDPTQRPEGIHESMVCIEQALQYSMRELDLVSGYLNKRREQKKGASTDIDDTIPPIKAPSYDRTLSDSDKSVSR